MKKRLLAMLLALCLLLSLVTVAAAEDAVTPPTISGNKVTINGAEYEITLQQGYTAGDGSLGFWWNHITRGFVCEDDAAVSETENTFSYYLVLRNGTYADAPKEVYEAFWAAYTLEGKLGDTPLPVSTTGDGYHKYITATVKGETSGNVTAIIKQGGAEVTQLTSYYSFARAKKLELSWTDNVGTAEVSQLSGYGNYFYYVDLETTPISVSVSGSLTGENVTGTVSLAQKAEGEMESFVWQRFFVENEPMASPQNATTDRLLLRFGNTSANVAGGTVTVTKNQQPQQPDTPINPDIPSEVEQLLYRSLMYDQSTNGWVENEEWGLQSMSTLTPSPGNGMYAIRLYYGTPGNAQPLSGGSITSSNGDVIAAAGTNDPYCTLEPKSLGSATISYGEYSFDVTVTLPPLGFYKAWPRDAEHYINYFTNLSDLTDGVLWLMTENGITEANKSSFSLTLNSQNYAGFEWVQRGSADAYDVKITLPTPDENTTSYHLQAFDGSWGAVALVELAQQPSQPPQADSSAAYIDDLVIGLAREESDGDVTIISEGLMLFGTGTLPDSTSTSYSPMWQVKVSAATKSTEGHTVVYTEDERVCDTLTIKRMWLENTSGSIEAFSLSDEAGTLSIGQQGSRYVWLYGREGLECSAKLFAEVTGKVNGEDFTVTVSAPISRSLVLLNNEQRPANDTVETLNARLEELAQTLNYRGVYSIYLANTTYEGTIVIPSEFSKDIALHLYGGDSTILKGGIAMNGAFFEQIYNINFIADENEAVNSVTKALYGSGCTFMRNCSFRGYDIAVDSSDGIINAYQNNVFVGNKTAILVDIADVAPGTEMYNLFRQSWSRNTFISNDTAVQVLSLRDPITPYYFRIFDSNFIGNETDLDIQCQGRFYMYRNFFGIIHPQARDMERGAFLKALSSAKTEKGYKQLVTSNSPEIETADSRAKVITNPRQKHPVKNWWPSSIAIDELFGRSAAPSLLTESAETEYTEVLTADWALETEIINEESGELKLDESAFDAEGEKVVTVVDENSQSLGYWTFE